MWGKYLNKYQLQHHLVKLKKSPRFSYLPANSAIIINKREYKYFQSRLVAGKIKTVTVKRDSLGDIYIYIVSDAQDDIITARTGKSVGYDFGLKTFLTASDGDDIISPLFFASNSKTIKQKYRSVCLEDLNINR